MSLALFDLNTFNNRVKLREPIDSSANDKLTDFSKLKAFAHNNQNAFKMIGFVLYVQQHC